MAIQPVDIATAVLVSSTQPTDQIVGVRGTDLIRIETQVLLAGVSSTALSAATAAVTPANSRITSLSTVVAGLSTGVTSLSTGLSNAVVRDTSLSTLTNNLSQSVSTLTAGGGTASLSTAVLAHTSQITSASTLLTTHTSQVTSLSTTIAGVSTGVTSVSTALSNYTVVTNSAINSLSTAALATNGPSLSTAVGSLSTAANATNGTVTAHTSSLTSLSTGAAAASTSITSLNSIATAVQTAVGIRAVSVFSPVQMRLLTGLPNGTRILLHQARNVAQTRPMGGGEFYVDTTDTTTADDGATVVALADGTRAKRRITDGVWASWWGTYGDGLTSDSAQIQAAVTFAGDTLDVIFDPRDTHLFTAAVTATGRLSARSAVIKGLIGSTVFDGSGLPDNEHFIYLQRPYSRIEGIKFLGKSTRTVSALNLGRIVSATIYAAHSTIVRSCEFVQCKNALTSQYACHVRVESCKFDSCYKGVELDKTSNTWSIVLAVAFNFVAATSHSFVHVIDADQVSLEKCWLEQNSVPAIVGERFTNISVESSWIEHLVVGNAQPLFVVNGSATTNPYNFVVSRTALVTNYPTVAQLTNLQNFELRNVRQAGLATPNVLPQIACTDVDLVKMSGVYCEYSDNPSSLVNRFVVTGAMKYEPGDGDNIQLVSKPYENKVFDSSFKTITNATQVGDAVITLDATQGVHDGSSMKIAFGAAGTGRARTLNTVNLVAGQYVRLSAYLWTDSDTIFNKVILRIAGQTSGKNRQFSLTKTPRRFEVLWQVPAGGAADGAYFAYFDYAVQPLPNRAYNVWVDDVEIVVDSAPIPYLPYVMNNSLTVPMKIGAGLNTSEHTFMGRRVTSGTAAPTAGTWDVGDRCRNVNATPGGVPGWVCVTAGGTGVAVWEAESPLSNAGVYPAMSAVASLSTLTSSQITSLSTAVGGATVTASLSTAVLSLSTVNVADSSKITSLSTVVAGINTASLSTAVLSLSTATTSGLTSLSTIVAAIPTASLSTAVLSLSTMNAADLSRATSLSTLVASVSTIDVAQTSQITSLSTVITPINTSVNSLSTQLNTVDYRTSFKSSTAASTTTATPNGNTDFYAITAQAAALTIANPNVTGPFAPVDGFGMVFRIKDDGTARAITWGAAYRAMGIGLALPITTVAGKTMYVGCIYNAADSTWDAISVATQT